jgi:hypothetical protein
MSLRYGENPHQKGAFYGNFNDMLEQIHGKEISYNNLLDINAAVELINDFAGETTFAILKHNNACGLASRPTLAEAWDAALAGDPVSAFGGVLIANAANFGTNSFISSDGTLGTTSGIKIDMPLDYSVVNCYINGFTKNKVDLSLVMAIYTIEDGIVTYVQKDGTYAGEVTQGGVTLNVVTFRKIAELVGRTDIDIIVPIEPKDEQE